MVSDILASWAISGGTDIPRSALTRRVSPGQTAIRCFRSKSGSESKARVASLGLN